MTTELKRFLINFGVSGSAAVVSKTLIAPVERAKLVLQNQDYALDVVTGKQRRYNGMLDFLLRVPREQGITSLWRGNGTNITRYFPSQALNFSLFHYFKNFFSTCITAQSYETLLLCKLTAGALAGATSAAVVFPLDFCQTRLSLDMGHEVTLKEGVKPREFAGLLNCFYKIAQQDGIAGLYRGVHMSIFGLAFYRALYFGLYDITKTVYHNHLQEKKRKEEIERQKKQQATQIIKRVKSFPNFRMFKAPSIQAPAAPHEEEHCHEDEKLPLYLSILLAQACAVTSGYLSYPLDTIARHMMMDSGRPASMRKNTGWWCTTRGIYRKGGVNGFFKGALANILRCTSGGMVLVMYDEIIHYINVKFV